MKETTRDEPSFLVFDEMTPFDEGMLERLVERYRDQPRPGIISTAPHPPFDPDAPRDWKSR